MSALQVCTFSLADRVIAIPIGEIQEVVRSIETTPVPHAPSAVLGLANLRGQICTAVDLRHRLGFAAQAEVERTYVVLPTDEGTVCLVVDAVGDVIELAPESVEEPPETLRGSLGDLVRGFCRVGRDFVLLLDAARAAELGP